MDLELDNGKDIFDVLDNYEHRSISEWIQLLPSYYNSTCIHCQVHFLSKAESSCLDGNL